MNRLNKTLLLLSCAALTSLCLAEVPLDDRMPPEDRVQCTDKTERLRLAVDLLDGSHVIGVPEMEAIPITTSFAKMEIPLTKIRTFRITEDHESVRVELNNDDVITGIIDMPPLKLATLFGSVTIGVGVIETVSVLAGDAEDGLILHYSFDAIKEGRVIDKSGHQHHGKVMGAVGIQEGVKGQGIKTSSRDTYVFCDNSDFNLDGLRQFTAATWVNLDHYSTYGRMLNCNKPTVGNVFSLALGGNGSQAVFSVTLDDGKGAYVRLPRMPHLKSWHHVAGVYDGHTVKYFLDGKEIATADVPKELRGRPLYHRKGQKLFVGKCGSRQTWYDTHVDGTIDEVMLFNRALRPGEIEELAGNRG